MRDYRAWCAHKGFTPTELSKFLDEIEKLCRKQGIEIEVGEDQRVYCLGVRLGKVDEHRGSAKRVYPVLGKPAINSAEDAARAGNFAESRSASTARLLAPTAAKHLLT